VTTAIEQPAALRHFERMSKWPAGRWLFARLICFRAPYFASIRPRFVELRPGLCQVTMRKRRAVQNHIGTESRWPISVSSPAAC